MDEIWALDIVRRLDLVERDIHRAKRHENQNVMQKMLRKRKESTVSKTEFSFALFAS